MSIIYTARSLQSCPTLYDPVDGSPPDSPVLGILQARTLEWVAISFSNAWKWKVKGKSLSHVRLFVTPWTVAYQAPPSMGFVRQEYWSGVPLPSPNYFYNTVLLTIVTMLFIRSPLLTYKWGLVPFDWHLPHFLHPSVPDNHHSTSVSMNETFSSVRFHI